MRWLNEKRAAFHEKDDISWTMNACLYIILEVEMGYRVTYDSNQFDFVLAFDVE